MSFGYMTTLKVFIAPSRRKSCCQAQRPQTSSAPQRTTTRNTVLKWRPARQDMGTASPDGMANLNANRAPGNASYSQKFLVVGTRLIVYDRFGMLMRQRARRPAASLQLPTSPFQELSFSNAYRDEIFRFVQGAVCPKETSAQSDRRRLVANCQLAYFKRRGRGRTKRTPLPPLVIARTPPPW